MAALLGLDLPLLLVLVGIGLAIMEATAPGAHFIVLGVALILAGAVGMAFGSLASPLALAGMVLVFGAAALFAYRELDVYGGKGQAQTSDSDSLRGQTGRVTERITETGGEVKLENGGFNPYFRAKSFSGEIAEGEEVIVLDPGGGNVLTVESTDGFETDDIDRELARDAEDAARESDTETEEVA